jgi:hypothetical protein
LQFLTRHPVLVGVPMAMASVLAAGTIHPMLGTPGMPWGMLISALFLTPTLLCADYIRSWPETSVTLWMWFFMLLWLAAWGVQNWLPMPAVNLPWGGNRLSNSVIGMTGCMLALYCSQVCWARLNLRRNAAAASRDDGKH